MMVELVEIVPAANTLGENILWDDKQSCVWWTDILARQLLRYDPVTKSITRFDTPERLCSFALIEDSDRILAAFDSGVGLFRPGSPQIDWLSRPLENAKGLRLNDGRTDRQGRFWVGAMVEDGGAPRAELYRFDPGRGLVSQRGDIAISNALSWSPDGHRMYFADSMTRTIRCYDYDPRNGEMSGGQDFAKSEGPGGPDGGIVDAEGFVWSAQWGSGEVTRYTPNGRIDTVVPLPVSLPTCVGFGGAKLDLLYVTTARESLTDEALAQQPHAGNVFVYKTGVRGLCDARFVPRS